MVNINTVKELNCRKFAEVSLPMFDRFFLVDLMVVIQVETFESLFDIFYCLFTQFWGSARLGSHYKLKW